MKVPFKYLGMMSVGGFVTQDKNNFGTQLSKNYLRKGRFVSFTGKVFLLSSVLTFVPLIICLSLNYQHALVNTS